MTTQDPESTRGTDRWKAAALLAGATLSATAGCLGQPLVHGNAGAVNLIVTAFSILAGFLVAIIVILGDPSSLPPGSWSAARLARGELIRRLKRHKYLFLVYLVTLAVILLALLLDEPGVAKPTRIVVVLESAYLGLAVFAFLFSLRLPWVLAQTQVERIDLEIKRRKKADRDASKLRSVPSAEVSFDELTNGAEPQ